MQRQANRYYNGDQFQVGCDVSELDRDERKLCVRILAMHQSYSRLLLKTGAHSSTSLLGVLNDAKEKVIFFEELLACCLRWSESSTAVGTQISQR